jgi:hypothetical protein
VKIEKKALINVCPLYEEEDKEQSKKSSQT